MLKLLSLAAAAALLVSAGRALARLEWPEDEDPALYPRDWFAVAR